MPTHFIAEDNCWQDLLHCSFCGIEPPEAEALVMGPGVSICSDCAVLAVEVCSYEDRTAEQRHSNAMLVLRRFMSGIAKALLVARCPYCGNEDLAYEVVDIGVGQLVQATPYSCSCGATQFNSDVLQNDVTCEEWDKQWHAPQGHYDLPFPLTNPKIPPTTQ